MTTATKGVKISSDTLTVLKNFSTINSNILIKPGNVLTTISPIKNIMAQCVIEEEFDTEIGIWDLNKFLGTVSLFKSPRFDFGETSVSISDDSSSASVTYHYSEPKLLSTVNKKVEMPDAVLSITITTDILNELQRASSVLGVSDLAITNDGGDVVLRVLDKSDKSTNDFSVGIDGTFEEGAEFCFYFKMENLKMLPGEYTANITDRGVSEFVNANGHDLTYWIALEADSSYKGN